MKKITFLIASLFLLIYINSCAGYKPIFSSSNFKFVISDYSIKGNKKLGNQIYFKLNNVSRLNENNSSAQSIQVLIDVSKNKKATVKNSAGKIIEYEINLYTNIIVNNFPTEKEILNQNFNFNSSYKVQDQHSETLKLENKVIENLISKTYEDFLIKISEVIVVE